MSVRTRVGMVAALGAATSLLLVVALTQGATQDAPFDRERVDASGGILTYVPLEGIAAPDPLAVGASGAAVDAEGDTIGEGGEAEAQPTPDAPLAPRARPPLWSPPTDPYFGSPQAGDPAPQLPQEPRQPLPPLQPPAPAAPTPDDGGATAPDAPATEPPAGGDPVVAEPGVEVTPTAEPVDPKTDGEESATPGPLAPPAETGGEDATTPPPAPPDSGAVDGGAAPEDETVEEPAEELPSTDVIEGVEPPPAELLPAPETAP